MVSWVEAAAFLGLGAIWGSAFLFINWASACIPPFTIVAMRLMIATVCLVSFVTARHLLAAGGHELTMKTLRNKSFYPKVIVMGILNNAIPFSLVAWGEQRVNVGTASILDSTIPLFAQIFAPCFLENEKITVKRAIGLCIGFMGVIAVCLPTIIDNGNMDTTPVTANISENVTIIDEAVKTDVTTELIYSFMIIGASMSYASASIWGKRNFCSDYDDQVVAAGQSTTGAVITALVALSWEYNVAFQGNSDYIHFGFFQDITTKGWIAIAYLGTISTVVAYVLYFFLLKRIGSVKQTMVGFLLPVFGVFEGAIINGDWERTSDLYKALEVVGAVLVVAGVGLVTLNFRSLCGLDGADDDGANDTSKSVNGFAKKDASQPQMKRKASSTDTEQTPLLV